MTFGKHLGKTVKAQPYKHQKKIFPINQLMPEIPPPEIPVKLETLNH